MVGQSHGQRRGVQGTPKVKHLRLRLRGNGFARPRPPELNETIVGVWIAPDAGDMATQVSDGFLVATHVLERQPGKFATANLVVHVRRVVAEAEFAATRKMD